MENAPRVAALVGPFASGKTAILESILHLTGKVPRKGSANDSNRVGDASAEAKARQMSVEAVLADVNYLDQKWTFVDTPGSIEFMQDSMTGVMAADIAIVVCEADPARAVMVTPILKFLSERNIPHVVFINKIENKKASIAEVVDAIRAVSDRPLVQRQLPLIEGDEITGYVDLTSERAYKFADGEYDDNTSKHMEEIPGQMTDQMELSRQDMLESVADYNDELLEKLLEEELPPMADIFESMKLALADGNVVPVLFGSAEQDHGILRLLKLLRHEVAGVDNTIKRLGVEAQGNKALVFKTFHATHTGKQSVSRILSGTVADGGQMGGFKVSGLYELFGDKNNKISKGEVGDVVALGRLDEIETGELLTEDSHAKFESWPEPLEPMFSFSISAAKKGEEVKMSGALQKMQDEDPSLSIEHNKDTNEMLLWGQGEIHLQVAMARLEERFNVAVEGERPTVPYKETIKKKVQQQGRHKKQSGGAGQFGDVHIEIKPLPRSEGFEFVNKIVGGAVPRNYIPAVETGCRDYMSRGPLGFQVEDVSVTLYDGSYHSVDSSDQAFKMAGNLAMREGLPKCGPVLLEPILSVEVSIPTEWTSGAQRALSQRRGQILGFEQKPGWEGWDVLKSYLPQSEMHDLIIELRSLTMGVGTFSWKFDHLQELTGREADIVVEARKEALENK